MLIYESNSLGLSSMLDTIDTTSTGQGSYFGGNWELVKEKFDKEYAFKLVKVAEIINET